MRRILRRFALFDDERSPDVRNFTYPAVGWPSAESGMNQPWWLDPRDQGQIHGRHCAGPVLREDKTYDGQSADVLTGSFMDAARR
jgi:hypothetical protein